MIKLAIIDDDHMFRSILIALIKPFKNIDIIINEANGRDLINSMQKQKPDIVLLDLNMPVMDGIATTDYLYENHPDVKILILTGYENEDFFNYLIKKGVNGFLPKGNNFHLIIRALVAIHKDGYYFGNEDLKRAVLAKKIKLQKTYLQGVIFSKREIEIIQLICQQYTNKEISEKLFISSRTVDGHRNKLLQKINARNTVGLVIYAMQNNLITKQAD